MYDTMSLNREPNFSQFNRAEDYDNLLNLSYNIYLELRAILTKFRLVLTFS